MVGVHAQGMVGDQRVSIQVLRNTETLDTKKAKQAIASCVVHSIDAYILREILRTMPKDAPISTIHDCFNTASCYVGQLQLVGREAYKKATNRDYFEKMMGVCFGEYRPLPAPGKLKMEDLDNSEYFLS